MTPGPDIILACPACGVLSRLFTLTSGHDAGSTSWTDGYRECPYAPQQPNLLRCRACGHLHWTAQAREIGMIDPLGMTPEGGVPRWADFSLPEQPEPGTPAPQAWVDAPLLTHAEESDYLEALREGLAQTKEQEIELRVHAWWRGNDTYRHSKAHGRYPQSEAAVENLERLVDLLEDGEHELQLFRAEGLRQLGRFDEAREAIYGICSDYALAREKIAELLQAKSRDLAVLFD